MTTHHFAVQGVCMTVTLAAPVPVRRLFPSLHALQRAPVRSRGWRISATLCRDCRTQVPDAAVRMRVWPAVDLAQWETQKARVLAAEGVRVELEPAARRARIIFTRGALHAAERLGRVLVMEILRTEGLYTLHAGAVETGHGAVLVCGASGSGKTTLATAWPCLGNARFMAEDRCLVTRCDGRIWAAGIADEVGLRPDTLGLLRGLNIRMPRARVRPDQKLCLNVHDVFLSSCSEPYPVRAMIFVAANRADMRLVPVAPDAAFRLLQEGSFFRGPGNTMQRHFDLLTALASDIPAYEAPGRADCRQLVAALDDYLAGPPVTAGYPQYPRSGRHSRRAPRMVDFDAGRHVRRIVACGSTPSAAPVFDELRWVEIVRAADAAGLLAPLAAALAGNLSLAACREPVPNVLRVAVQRAKTAYERHLILLRELAPSLDAAARWVLVDGAAIAARCGSPPWARDSGAAASIALRRDDAVVASQALAALGFEAAPRGGADAPVGGFLIQCLRHPQNLSRIVLHVPQAAVTGVPDGRVMETLISRSVRIDVGCLVIPVLSLHDQFAWCARRLASISRRNSLSRTHCCLDVARLWRQLDRNETGGLTDQPDALNPHPAHELARPALRAFPTGRRSRTSGGARPHAAAPSAAT